MKLSQLITMRMLKIKSKTRKALHQIRGDIFLLESNLSIEELF
jgi:hypothetical protein